MKKNQKPVLAIIGGGASGLASAVFSAKADTEDRLSIRIFESNSRVGKKLLVTGNGRCNFSNSDMNESHFHGDTELARHALNCFSWQDTVEFFKSGGVFAKTDNAGRIYPLSNQASSVLDFFRSEIDIPKIETVTDFEVTEIRRCDGRFLINNSEWADAVIIACGGKAAPVHGSRGMLFPELNRLGIKTTPFCPALTPLCVESFTKALKGIRAEGKITVKQNGKIIASDRGELQYTDYGISGIPAMQVSGRAVGLLGGKDPVYLHIDNAPSITEDELKAFILTSLKASPEKPVEMLLSGIMPKRLAVFLLSELSFNPEKAIKSIHPAAVDKIVSAVKNKKFKLQDVKGFADAQISSGGVPSSELVTQTLETKKIKNMFVCGEAVNIDGDCGGYNLQWAWSSAYVAANAAVKELTDAQNK